MSIENPDGGPHSEMSQGDVNRAFADITATEEQKGTGEPVIIIRPNGQTETTIADPSGNFEATLTTMSPEARAAALAREYKEVQARYGRSDTEQESLKAALNDASARFQAALEEDRRARREEPGSAARLAALQEKLSAHDAVLAAILRYYENK